MKTCMLHCSPVYQSVARCIAACHLKCKPVNIGQRQSILRNIPGDKLLYPRLLTDTPGNSVADGSSYTLSLTDIPVYLYTPRIYPNLLTDTSGTMQLAGLHILCCWLIFGCPIQVTGPWLYPGLLTDIPGNRAADAGLRILCRWQVFWYTIQVTGHYTPRYWLTQGYSVAERSSYTLSLTNIPVYSPSARGGGGGGWGGGAISRVTDWYTG